MSDSIEVVALNLHNERRAARWVHDRAPHVGMVSEAQHVLRSLRQGTRITTGRKERGRNMPQEVAVLLDGASPNLGESSELISREWEPAERVAPDKWGHVAVTRLLGVEVACVAIHPPAGPEVLAAHDPDHPIVQRYRECMLWLDLTVSYQLARNRALIVGGDLQMGERTMRPWSPDRILRRYGFQWFWQGIDAIAWTAPFRAVGREVVGEAVHGSDHPALIVELTTGRRS